MFEKHQEEMDKMNRWFNITFAVAIGIIFLTIVVTGVLVYFAGDFLITQDYSEGVKPIWERFWCGSSGCPGGE